MAQALFYKGVSERGLLYNILFYFILAITWLSCLMTKLACLVDVISLPDEALPNVTRNEQTLSHIYVSSTPPHESKGTCKPHQ